MDTTIEIPGFRLDRMIGEGGFGQVWLAYRATDEARVAIKVLHFELVRSVDALTRFQRELDAIQRLHHPNVVRALDHGTSSDGRPYLVLEYVDGPSLREVIHQRGALPPVEMLEIFEPLCHALGVAHAAGLVHRDVKASNVILSRDARGPRPVLLDFGLVKLLDEVGPGLTSSRSMLGTPAAMAPEQMRGEPVDPRTDIYSLGLLAFHMLTGQPAFGSAPGVVQTYLQVHGPSPRPSSKVDIDPAIDEPIIRALSTNRDGRFESAAAFADALRAVIAPAAAMDAEVVAVYGESTPAANVGSHTKIRRVIELVHAAGMIVAIDAPDSVLAVAPRDRIDVAALRARLAELGDEIAIAIGLSRATIQGPVVDGPALDVEGWAPYPLPRGVWVGSGL